MISWRWIAGGSAYGVLSGLIECSVSMVYFTYYKPCHAACYWFHLFFVTFCWMPPAFSCSHLSAIVLGLAQWLRSHLVANRHPRWHKLSGGRTLPLQSQRSLPRFLSSRSAAPHIRLVVNVWEFRGIRSAVTAVTCQTARRPQCHFPPQKPCTL